MGDTPTIDRQPVDPQEKWRLLIGGEWTATSGTYEIVDPNTTAVVGHAPDGTVADAEAAITAAGAALPGWRDTPPAERGALLDRLADILRERAPIWSTLVQAETGSTINVAETMQVAVSYTHLTLPTILLV